MNQRIVYTNADGRICVVIPAPDSGMTIEQIAGKDVPAGVPYRIADAADIPADRTFRNAWTHDEAGIKVDMAKARDIHRDRLRALRAPKLKALDADYMRALEAKDIPKQADIIGRKQALRDVTADPAIEEAKTPEELAAAISKILTVDP